jgi:hypothetical protein
MRVKSVSYQKVFPIAQYGINERVGVEIDVDSNESGEEVLDKAREMIMDWAKANIPELLLPERDFPVQIKTIPEESPYPISDPNDEQFEALKKILEDCPTKELAAELLEKTDFRQVIELKEIVKNKP